MSADPYRAAGVDVAAGERAVRLMRDSVAATYRPEVVGGLGGFAGLFALDVGRYRRPLLVASTDGVGTKVALARDLGVLHTVGLDLVAMVVDDLVVCGAEPLFLQDYLACGRLDPVRVADIVAGVAEGCRKVGAALLGGETAEHPGLMGVDDFDLAGTAVGVVEADAVLGADRVLPGDTLVALASSGLHSNGFSLVRQVLRDSGAKLEEPFPGGRTLGSALLEPTRIYALDCLALAAGIEVHAFAHVTTARGAVAVRRERALALRPRGKPQHGGGHARGGPGVGGWRRRGAVGRSRSAVVDLRIGDGGGCGDLGRRAGRLVLLDGHGLIDGHVLTRDPDRTHAGPASAGEVLVEALVVVLAVGGILARPG